MYAVGVDIGTTYTAAAVWRDGRATIAALGSHSAAIPSAVFLRPDGTFLAGETATRRGLTEPDRVVRELKRRLGDTAPILLGGTPYSATALTARMLRSVLDAVSAREGGPPASVCVTHPAAWGPYKIDLMHQVVRLAGVEQPVRFSTEPQAAAFFHAQQHRLEPGAVLAAYDLGGGIFDAAVLRRTADGFDLVGQPEGIERFGGLELDDAILAHVTKSIGEVPKNPATVRLRAECTQAKEALSADTDAMIPVLLPTATTEVRLTRAELEAIVRPLLRDSIEALRRTIRSAGYAPQALGSVLLLGGSARMPIVAEMVGSELGRPVAVDPDPKHAVALGAAWQAGSRLTAPGPATPAPAKPTPVPAPDEDEPTGEIPGLTEPVAQAPTTTQPVAPTPTPTQPTAHTPTSIKPAAQPPTPTEPPARTPAAPQRAAQTPTQPMAQTPTPTQPAARTPGQTQTDLAAGTDPRPETGGAIPRRPLAPKTGFVARVPVGPVPMPAPAAVPPVPPARSTKAANGRVAAFAAAAVTVMLLAAGGTVWLLTRANSRDETATRAAAADQHHAGAAASSAPTSKPAAVVPADEQCTDQMKKSTRWVCLTKATLRDNKLTVWYDAEWHGSRPDIQTGFHLHLYGGDGAHPDESTMGSQAVKHSKYYFEDKEPSVRKTTDPDFEAVGNAKKVCARIARTGHGLEKAADGSYHTGNCIPIQRY